MKSAAPIEVAVAEPVERPILMSAPMLRALLAGTKTQTRRVAKFVALEEGLNFAFTGLRPAQDRPGLWALQSRDGATNLNDRTKPLRCPYGKPGDQLWVREAWTFAGTLDPGILVYRADYPNCVPKHYENIPPAAALKWRPSIHLARDQSRILLEVTEVRAQRLQDISEEDAEAEGVLQWGADLFADPKVTQYEIDQMAVRYGAGSLRCGYAALWDSINGLGSWAANPWVWAVSFRRVGP